MDSDWVHVFPIEKFGFSSDRIPCEFSVHILTTKPGHQNEKDDALREERRKAEPWDKVEKSWTIWVVHGAFAKRGSLFVLEGEKDMKQIGIVLVKCWVIEDATATGANWNRQGREVFCMTGDSHTYQDASNYLIWKCPLFFLTDYHLFVTNAAEKSAYMGTSFAAAQRLVDE